MRKQIYQRIIFPDYCVREIIRRYIQNEMIVFIEKYDFRISLLISSSDRNEI